MNKTSTSPAAALIAADPLAVGFWPSTVGSLAERLGSSDGAPDESAEAAAVLAAAYDRATSAPAVPDWLDSPAPELPHVSGYEFAGTAASDDHGVNVKPDEIARALEAFAGLARSEPGLRFLALSHEEPAVEDRARLRVGFRAGTHIGHGDDREANARVDAAMRRAAEHGGTERHVCALTGAEFWLPIGAPVPTLFADRVKADGTVGEYEVRATVHPDLVHAGPEAVARAVWADVFDTIETAASHLLACFEAVAMARALPTPDALGVEPPGTAYGAPGRRTGSYRQRGR